MVTVDPTFGGFKAVIGGRERSLGQLHAHTVGLEAVAHPAVRNLLTFTPPMGLRAYVEKMLGTKLIFTQDPASRTVRFVAESTGRRLVTDALGVRFEFEGARLLTIASYWGARDERQRRVEPAYQFHSENGAGIRLDLVMDNGDWQDPESLAFRTVLEYPLNK
ncbi:hypothetical protein HZC34_04615 [Candidatus Saganbacteria bacterium]|nr:hypothetical protein [Candidatus Saganbacteria bacterium]